MNTTEEEMYAALRRFEKEAARAGYQLRRLQRWLDLQPEDVRERWRNFE
jgi:hypothetical protein